MTPISGSRRPWLPIAVLVMISAGCSAGAKTEPVYAEAYHEPPRVFAMPRSHYDGRVVYLVDDHWYFYDRGHWFFYTVEPEPLYRRRVALRERPGVREARPPHQRRDYRPPERRPRHESAPAYVVPPSKRAD